MAASSTEVRSPSPSASELSDGSPRLGYQAALDGLRAVAVGAVMLYHGGVSWGRGGYLGVDAFFVISGFLITTLLVEEWGRHGHIALGAFWARRVRRLLPALVLVLLAIAAYAAFLAPDVSRQALRGDGLGTLFYVANWHLVLSHQSYFERFSAPSPLLHTWSLAVEEQWYVVWPIVVAAGLAFAARRWRGRHAVPADGRRGPRGLGWCALAALAAAGGSAVWMAHLAPAQHDTSRAYYGTDTRAQALLFGAALAFALARWPIRRPAFRRTLAVLGVAGGVVGVALFTLVDDRTSWMYRGGFALCALCWSAVVAAALDVVGGPVRSVLAQRPLVALGRISYGVYLWNWPAVVVLTPGRTGLDGVALFGVRVAATLLAASASYRLVELPIRSGRLAARRWWRPRAAVAGAFAVCALLLVAATLGAPAPITTTPGQVVASHGSGSTLVPVTLRPRQVPSTTAGPAGATPTTLTPPPAPTDRPLRVVSVGDSVGFTWIYYAPRIAGMETWTGALLGCGIFPNEVRVAGQRQGRNAECEHWLDSWHGVLAKDPDVALVFLGAWEVFDPYVDGHRLAVGTPAWRTFLGLQLRQGLDVLTRGTRVRVGLMTVPCMRPVDERGRPQRSERSDPARVAALNSLLGEAVSHYPGRVALVDYAGFACPGGVFRDRFDGVVLRPDGVHVDLTSAAVGWRWLAPQVLDLAHRPTL